MNNESRLEIVVPTVVKVEVTVQVKEATPTLRM